MKRSVFVFVFIFYFLSCEKLFAQTTFGAEGAFAVTNITESDLGKKMDTEWIPSYHAGLFADIRIGWEIFLHPEISFTQKGTRFHESDDLLKFSYVEIPVCFLVKHRFAGGYLLAGAGPYVAYAIKGEQQKNGSDVEITFKKEVSSADLMTNELFWRPLDIGAKIILGYQFKNRISFSVGSSLGLYNIQPKYPLVSKSEHKANTYAIGFEIGYRLK